MAITTEELQSLSILDALQENNRATQRELSEATGLNLAKVNFLLRRMTEKGQLKLRNISKSPNKLRYLYILTPGGLTEKSRLTLRFARRTLLEYSRTLAALRQRMAALQESGAGRIVLIGQGEVVDMVLAAVEEVEGLAVVGIVAANRVGSTRRGAPVIDTVTGVVYDKAVPCDDIEVNTRHLMKKAGIPKEKLWLM